LYGGGGGEGAGVGGDSKCHKPAFFIFGAD